MGRGRRRIEPEEETGSDLAVLLLVAASAATTLAVGYLLWSNVREGAGETRRSRRILRDLDTARETLRRQLTAGLGELADETRIRIAELERAIMQLEGFI